MHRRSERGFCLGKAPPDVGMQRHWAQTFAFDALNGRLQIAGSRVEAGGGRGQHGDPIQLAKCTGASNQIWRAEPVGEFYKFAGMNSLCFDIAHYSKDNGAGLQLWKCHSAS